MSSLWRLFLLGSAMGSNEGDDSKKGEWLQRVSLWLSPNPVGLPWAACIPIVKSFVPSVPHLHIVLSASWLHCCSLTLTLQNWGSKCSPLFLAPGYYTTNWISSSHLPLQIVPLLNSLQLIQPDCVICYVLDSWLSKCFEMHFFKEIMEVNQFISITGWACY